MSSPALVTLVSPATQSLPTHSSLVQNQSAEIITPVVSMSPYFPIQLPSFISAPDGQLKSSVIVIPSTDHISLLTGLTDALCDRLITLITV